MERFANEAATTLATGVSAGDLSLAVADPSPFPDSGDFRLRIGSEYLLVTGVSGSTFTVTRGVEGSSAASHSAGVAVTHVLTAGGLQGLADSVQSVDGSGVPDGGTTGQVLAKLSSTDGDADWRTPDVTQTELDAEASARAAADTTLQGHIDTEATARAAGDATNSAAAAAAQATADAALPKAGGTMTGKIVLDGDPTANLHPATKQWVVAQIVALINGAPGALDTLKEIDDQLAADESAVSALTSTVSGKLSAASNLADLVNAVTARTNLGLGTAATHAHTDYDAAGAAAAAQAASQPLDSDLTAIAALTTAAFGLGLLTKTSAAAVLSYIGAAAASHTHAESDITGLTADLAAKAQALTRTAVKTANYTAAAGDYVPVDTTSGSITVTLPSAPADKSRIGVKQILRGGTNTVTIACGGSDVINRTGGSTTLTLTLLAESALLQYDSGSATWTVQANDAPLSQLDARYAVLASPAFTGSPTAPTQTASDNSTKLATTAYVDTASGLLVPKSLVDAKGDLFVGTADNTVARKAVGANGRIFRANSAQSDGLEWVDPIGPSYKSGDYIGVVHVTDGSNTFTNGNAYFSPIYLWREASLDAMAVWVRVLAATSTVRLGIYNDAAGRPSTLIQDAGTVASTATGAKVATIAQTLMPGMYWGCGQPEGGSPGLNSFTNKMPFAPALDITTAYGGNGFFYAHTGALAADVSAVSLTGTQTPPLIYVRKA